MIEPAEIGARAREAAAGVLWAQWAALGSLAAPPRGSVLDSLIDPEALVLASLALAPTEPRLGEMAAWWARDGAALLSTQRMGALLARFPAEVADALPDFARRADEAGDRRWRRIARDASGETLAMVREREAGPVRLTRPAALMLRLRAGFGVGAKSDLLAVLLGMRGQPAALRTLSAATGYTPRALRTAAREMELAGLLEETQTRPATYRAHVEPWLALLTPPGTSGSETRLLRWRFWGHALAFLTHVDAWAAAVEQAGCTPYVAASRARDLFERHREAFVLNGVRTPDPRDHPGPAFLRAFAAAVDALAAWATGSPDRALTATG